MRKLRLKTEEKVKIAGVDSIPRDVAQRLMFDLLQLETSEVAKTITQPELMDLIDDACLLDMKVKEQSAQLDKMKKALKAVAQEQGWKEKESTLGRIKIDSSTSLVVDPRALADKLREMGKAPLFKDLVTVRMTEATRYLGREVLEGIGNKTTEEYGRMTLKVK